MFKLIEPYLRRAYSKMMPHSSSTLRGDREVEYSWIAQNMPDGPGEALDFGPGRSWLSLLCARKGYRVLAIDLSPVDWAYVHPQMTFRQGNILNLPLSEYYGKFDVIINCSTVEHVGLAGRYGTTESDEDGDLKAMKILKQLATVNGQMLLTIPAGIDGVFSPFHRVYGRNRLPKLLDSWTVIQKEYWVKDSENRWKLTNEDDALTRKASESSYGLGLYVLTPETH